MRKKKLIVIALALIAVLGFVVLFIRAQALPQGPVPIVWDKEVCAHCKMHIGDRGFAAQAQTADGRVLNFDDPGCLFEWLDGFSSAPRALYFHHVAEDRWLSTDQVAFQTGAVSPMGHGLAAVERGKPGSVSIEEARALVRAGRNR